MRAMSTHVGVEKCHAGLTPDRAGTSAFSTRKVAPPSREPTSEKERAAGTGEAGQK